MLMCMYVCWLNVCTFLRYGCVHKIDEEVSFKVGLIIAIFTVYVNVLKHMDCHLCHML